MLLGGLTRYREFANIYRDPLFIADDIVVPR